MMKRSLILLSSLLLACQKDAGVTTPGALSQAVRIGLRAQVTAPAGSALDLRVVYFDKAATGDTAIVLADSQFTIDTGAHKLSLSVSVASCLNDTARVNPSPTTCALSVIGRLLVNGLITDSVMLPPVPASPGGSLRDSTSISLSTSRTWVGGAAGAPSDWFNPANWSPATVPVAGSAVFIEGGVQHPPAYTPVLGANVTVKDLYLNGAGADVKVNGRHLTVTGFVNSSGGTLTMTNPSDTVTADTMQFTPNFSVGSSNPAGHDTTGVLQVGGSFVAYTGSFAPAGSLQVVATGSGLWEVDTIPVLTVTGPATTVSFIKTTGQTGPYVAIGTLNLTNGASVATFGAFAPRFAVLNALNTAAGTTLAPAWLTVVGTNALAGVKGTYAVDTTIFEPPGTNTVVTIPSLSYQHVIVRGGALASFAGATTFGGGSPQLWIDSASTVTNTQTLTFATTDTAATVVQTTNGGMFASLSPVSVVNAPVGKVAFLGGSESGLLTAGTWTVGNGFSGTALSTGNAFSLIVDGGTATVPAQIIADTLGSVTVTNNAVARLFGLTGTTVFSTIVQNLTLTNGATLFSFYPEPTVNGTFTASPGTTGAPPRLVNPSNYTLTVANANVTALVDSNVPFLLNGSVTAFQNVTFEGFNPALGQAMLQIVLTPGTALTLTNITFQPLLTTDASTYVTVTNAGGPTAAPVTLNISHDPGNGAVKTFVAANVRVNWSP